MIFLPMRVHIIFLVTILVFLLLSPHLFASQYGQYGAPAPTQRVLIDKMVGKPADPARDFDDTEYVDNLSPSDPRFKPGQTIIFRIKVKNISDDTIDEIRVKDFLAPYLESFEGPATIDNGKIEFWVDDLDEDEEQIFHIKAKIKSQDDLPSDKTLLCVINKAEAFIDDERSDEDSSQFCIEKQILGAAVTPTPTSFLKEIPKTGASGNSFVLLGMIFSLTTGFFLMKVKA